MDPSNSICDGCGNVRETALYQLPGGATARLCRACHILALCLYLDSQPKMAALKVKAYYMGRRA